MSDLVEWLHTATRTSLLRFIARAIHSLTIRSRAFYDDAEGHDHMAECNEAIHRLAGHLVRLTDATCELDNNCAESVAANIRLPPEEVERLKGLC